MVFGTRGYIHVRELAATNAPILTSAGWPTNDLTGRKLKFWNLLTGSPQKPSTLAKAMGSQSDNFEGITRNLVNAIRDKGKVVELEDGSYFRPDLRT